MSNQITGRLVEIGQTIQIPSKTGSAPFLKREFLLDATTYDPYTGQRSEYENILPLEVSGDKCAELDQFRMGDVITVSFALQGRSWTNQDGELRRMVSIRCYKLELRRTSGQTVVQSVQQTSQPASVVSQPTMVQAFPPSVDANGNLKDDLPF
jgi:hypothetical protein